MTKPIKIFLRVGIALMCLGILIGVGSLVWAFAKVSSDTMPQPEQLAFGIIGYFIGIPIFVIGSLTTLISTVVHLLTKPKTIAAPPAAPPVPPSPPPLTVEPLETRRFL